METKFTLSQAQFDQILAINKEGGDPVMFLGGGIRIGKDLHEKINEYWETLGREMGFDWKTVRPIDNMNFYAETRKHNLTY
jgi:hypothetical protein